MTDLLHSSIAGSLLVSLLLFVAPPSARADHGSFPPNWIGGTIAEDLTLTAAAPGPVYYVYADLTISPGRVLTIQDGVTLQVAARSDFFASGQVLDRVELIVQGTLLAQGTSASGIAIRSDIPDGSAAGPTSDDWAGIRIEPFGSVTGSFLSVKHCRIGYDVSGHLSLSNSEIAFARNRGIAGHSGGSIAMLATSVHDCTNFGAFLESCDVDLNLCNFVAGNALYTDACNLRLRGNVFTELGSGGTGLELHNDVDTTPDDAENPVPNIVRSFSGGIYLYQFAQLRNVLVYGCGLGIVSPFGCGLNYVTVARNGAAGVGPSTVRNSIVALNNSGLQTTSISFSAVWDNSTWNFSPNPGIGPSVAVFDPRFTDPDAGNFELSQASLFRDYSDVEGEIGAYGPGPSGPTATQTVTLLATDVRRDGVRLEWASNGFAGGAVLICRAASQESWAVVGESPIGRDGRVVYDDRPLVPGQTYRYGIARRSGEGITVDGVASVMIPSVPSLSLVQGPIGGSTITAAIPRQGEAVVSAYTVTGRLLCSERVVSSRAGYYDVVLPIRARGVYLVSARMGEETATGKFVLVH